MKKFNFKLGPGVLVTAAFIGPGTITACSLAGANFGYALLWALLFSVFATIVLQEMSARLGIITQKGLGEVIRSQFTSPLAKGLSILLVVSAILIGNGAYEAGNISGAGLGMESLVGALSFQVSASLSINLWGIIIGGVAFVLLLTSSYKLLERVLIGLVVLMSIVFISTVIIAKPPILSILKGVFVPKIPQGSVYTIIGLIGTTVVPYNLFLHSSAVKERWKDISGLKEAKKDTVISMVLGGFISMAIVIAATMAFFGTGMILKNSSDLAVQLRPLLGGWAEIFMGIGLFAAGISSSITAPLAASYATAGILGWKVDLKDTKFRLVWMFILFIGTLFYSIGFKPITVIMFAQVANGILLPIVAVYLVWLMNSESLLGKYKNTLWNNIAGGIIVLIAVGLGAKSVLNVFGVL